VFRTKNVDGRVKPYNMHTSDSIFSIEIDEKRESSESFDSIVATLDG